MLQPLVDAPSPPPPTSKRLASLDILRGFTVLLMVFVDEAGVAFPAINHSAWDGITLADFVMPWFLFMVGTSLSLSLRKYRAARKVGTRAILTRALKLIGLGLLLQGGGWFDGYSYGFNLATIRFCGILNRIGFAFGVGALIELWVPERELSQRRARVVALWPRLGADVARRRSSSPHLAVFSTQVWRWLAAATFVALHLCLTLWTWVPTWTSHYGYNANTSSATLLPPHDWFEVKCDVRGADALHSPQCSAAGFYDRLLFGQQHLGVWMSKRLPTCSLCAPGQPSSMYRPTCEWAPNALSPGGDARWCFAHIYDPEGSLSTLPTVGSVWLGVHFGRVTRVLSGRHLQILLHFACCAVVLIAFGLALHYTCLPMNKQLWSTSYLLFMGGTCGATLAIIYAAVDANATTASNTNTNTNNSTSSTAQPEEGVRSPGSSSSTTTNITDITLTIKPKSALVRFQSSMRYALYPLEAMGMNAILFFFWHGTAEAVINAFYCDPPVAGGGLERPKARTALLGEEGWVHEELLLSLGLEKAAARQMALVLCKLVVYLVVAVVLARRRYFWKL